MRCDWLIQNKPLSLPKQTKEHESRRHIKGIANPQVRHQRMAYPLERGLGLIIYDASGGFDNTLYNDAWLKNKHQYIRYEFEPTYYRTTAPYQRFY